MLIVGGRGSGSGVVSTAEIYDPVSGLFTVTGSLLTGSASHTVTKLANGKVLIAGGYGSTGQIPRAEVYVVASGTFAAVGSMLSTRGGHSASLLGDGTVLIAAGTGGPSNSGIGLAELYEPTRQIFAPAGQTIVTRGSTTATVLGDARCCSPAVSCPTRRPRSTRRKASRSHRNRCRFRRATRRCW